MIPVLAFLLTAAPTPSKPTALFSMGDYPKEAMKRREEGTVRARIKISPQGRVTGCAIVESATPALNAATCDVLVRRAKFKPARDPSGLAIESEIVTPPINWRIGDPPKRKSGLRL